MKFILKFNLMLNCDSQLCKFYPFKVLKARVSKKQCDISKSLATLQSDIAC